MENDFTIFEYSRKQAIDDGILIDVTPAARSQGFRLHTVITDGLALRISANGSTLESVLFHLMQAIGANSERTDRICFSADGMELWAIVGPGDTPAPVLTIMLVGED